MFDEFLRERASARRAVRPFDAARRLRRATSTASRGSTACGRSSQSRGIELPEGGRRPAGPRPSRLGTRKNELVLELHRERGRRALRRLGALRRRGARRGPARARSSRRARTPREVLEAAGHRRPLRGASSTASSPSARSLPGKPAPDTFLAGRARARRRAGARRRCSRTRSRASRPGRAGGFGFVVGVDRTGQADALRAARRRRRRAGPRRAAGGGVIERATSSPSSPGRSASTSSTSTCSPRPSRSSRCPTATSACAATSTRASRRRRRART